MATMAVSGSTLLSLCFGMLLISASSADYPHRCMFFNTVFHTTGPGIKINSNIYESNRVYTISVPVDNTTSSVALRAVDTNNSLVGLWQRANQYCNDSVLYHLTDTREGFFKANWQSPHATNITVEIQAFAINLYRVATFSSLKLEKQAMITTSPSMTSMTSMTSTTSKTSMTSMSRLTTTQSPTTNRILTTVQTAKPTLTTTKSFANRIFLSPITDAIQILLVFLTSKLLF